MNKIKTTCVYLSEVQLRYLALISMIHSQNKSEYLRNLVDADMRTNSDIVNEYSQILFADNPNSL